MRLNLQERIAHVESRVEKACQRSGRERKDVEIIAVTKYASLETTGQVLQSGLKHIGENRWQDAKAKWEAFGSLGTWHFIGHLQTNKVKDLIGKFHFIHSLDRLSLAEEIQKRAESADVSVPCLIQVNVSGEKTKHGLAPDQLFSFAEQIKRMDRIRIVGLMTMAPHEDDPERTRPVFRELRRLKDQLNEKAILGNVVTHLSMGMSNDFEVAVEEGATMIRLGSVLVGKQ